MEILITGATGFAGNVLLDLLPRTVRYTKITVFVLPGDPGQARMRNKGIRDLQIVHGDISDSRAVDRAVAGHSHVIHLAGLISYWNRDRAKLVRVNERGVENVVAACIRHGVSRLIHVASVGTIGFNRDGSLADEETEFNWPESFAYMTTKRAGQQVVERAVRERKLPAIILNPASLMGPGDPIADTPHNQLYDRIRNKVLFGCFAGGLAVTDVRDLASIIIKALSTGRVGEKYLVVGANVTYREVVETIGACFHRKVYPFPVPWFILAWAGRAMEWVSVYTGRRPPLTWAYGRLSGWFSYYSNARSREEFTHDYIPFQATVADACAYFEKDLGGGKA